MEGVYYARVKKDEICKYIPFSCTDKPKDFLLKIISEFDLSDVTFVIKDPEGTVIDIEKLIPIVQQYKFCFSFILMIELENSKELTNAKSTLKRCNAVAGLDLVMNSQVLEYYLKTHDCIDILKEYSEKKSLKDSSRRRLVSTAVSLLREHFGNYPTKEEKISVAKSIVTLFPTYKTAEGKFGGIVSEIGI